MAPLGVPAREPFTGFVVPAFTTVVELVVVFAVEAFVPFDVVAASVPACDGVPLADVVEAPG